MISLIKKTKRKSISNYKKKYYLSVETIFQYSCIIKQLRYCATTLYTDANVCSIYKYLLNAFYILLL